MKGLRKYISPFSPDQSGAASVLFGYGGMLIIMDAGGCVGNVCGYDEPRWGGAKSAIFSAGLRDLDAILGRDELLIRKIRHRNAGSGHHRYGLSGAEAAPGEGYGNFGSSGGDQRHRAVR